MVVVNGGMAWLNNMEWVLYNRDLMRILLAAFFAVLPMLIGVFVNPVTPLGLLVLQGVHFVITAVLLMGVLLFIEPTGRDFTLRTGAIALLLYLGVYVLAYLKDRRIARSVNRKLDELHLHENETHDS